MNSSTFNIEDMVLQIEEEFEEKIKDYSDVSIVPTIEWENKYGKMKLERGIFHFEPSDIVDIDILNEFFGDDDWKTYVIADELMGDSMAGLGTVPLKKQYHRLSEDEAKNLINRLESLAADFIEDERAYDRFCDKLKAEAAKYNIFI